MLPSSVRIYVAAEPVDLRRGFDGLAAATRTLIREDPLTNGHLCGSFHLATQPAAGQRHVEVDAGELGLMVGGVDLRGALGSSAGAAFPTARGTSALA